MQSSMLFDRNTNTLYLRRVFTQPPGGEKTPIITATSAYGWIYDETGNTVVSGPISLTCYNNTSDAGGDWSGDFSAAAPLDVGTSYMVVAQITTTGGKVGEWSYVTPALRRQMGQ